MKLKKVDQGVSVCPDCRTRSLKQVEGKDYDYECESCKATFIDEDAREENRGATEKSSRSRTATITDLTRIIIYLSRVKGASMTTIKENCNGRDTIKAGLHFLLNHKIVFRISTHSGSLIYLNPLFKIETEDETEENE